MQKYVVGFAFDEKMEKVALIHKIKPAWQVGKINGIGGKMESDESASIAIEREFCEEAGITISAELWDLFVILSGPDWRVYFLRAFGVDVRTTRTMEEEKVEVYDVRYLPNNVIHNLRWLIPMALDLDIRTPITVEDRTTNA